MTFIPWNETVIRSFPQLRSTSHRVDKNLLRCSFFWTTVAHTLQVFKRWPFPFRLSPRRSSLFTLSLIRLPVPTSFRPHCSSLRSAFSQHSHSSSSRTFSFSLYDLLAYHTARLLQLHCFLRNVPWIWIVLWRARLFFLGWILATEKAMISINNTSARFKSTLVHIICLSHRSVVGIEPMKDEWQSPWVHSLKMFLQICRSCVNHS